ncbi:MAG: hypothetical protein V4682_00140 [Patescibacteria group bacterium]
MSNNGIALPDLPESVTLSAKEMESGEVRVRIAHAASGLSACITSNAEHHGAEGWQNSHRHLTDMKETYVVQEGWLVVVTLDEITTTPLFEKYEAGSVFTLSGGAAHNVYVSAGTVFATMKHGSREGRNDWKSAPELDALLVDVGPEDFEHLRPRKPIPSWA